jgi:hypothetical protein
MNLDLLKDFFTSIFPVVTLFLGWILNEYGSFRKEKYKQNGIYKELLYNMVNILNYFVSLDRNSKFIETYNSELLKRYPDTNTEILEESLIKGIEFHINYLSTSEYIESSFESSISRYVELTNQLAMYDPVSSIKLRNHIESLNYILYLGQNMSSYLHSFKTLDNFREDIGSFTEHLNSKLITEYENAFKQSLVYIARIISRKTYKNISDFITNNTVVDKKDVNDIIDKILDE